MTSSFISQKQDGFVFLTGVTGFLGRFLLAEILATHSFAGVMALTKSQVGQPGSAVKRVRNTIEALCSVFHFTIHEEKNTLHITAPDGNTTPLIVLDGDITLENFGFSSGYDFRSVTHVCHTAAVTNLVAPEELFEWVNIGGTQNVLGFSQENFKNLERFCYVGTAYDLYSGVETFLPAAHPSEPQSFVNGYSRSKWLARKAVVDSGLPHIICLPGIITGCNSNGYLPEDVPLGVIYAPPQGMALLKRVCLPFSTGNQPLGLDFCTLGYDDATLNVIPVDTAAVLLNRILASEKTRAGNVYYLTNPQSLPVCRILDTASEVIGVRGIRLVRDLSQCTQLEKLFGKVLSPYQPFMLGQVNQYDLSTTLAVAPDVPIPPPDKLLLMKLFTYVDHYRDWGYNQPGAMYKDSYIEQIQKRFIADIKSVVLT